MLGAIWAQSRDGVIGNGTGMPWHIPEDMRHFKEVTLSHPVIMGRRTWNSLPDRFRPLPDRENIVLTSHPRGEWSDGATLIDDPAVITSYSGWVMGGGQLYAATLGVVDKLEVTYVDVELADETENAVFAPVIDERFTQVTDSGWLTSAGGRITGRESEPVRYRFVNYERKDS